ncbi:MAG TPA: hypothetical protein PKZ64_14630 [Spirochaetota bacterium]|nr:hypothetical protein [Spirochaetota bacterium]
MIDRIIFILGCLILAILLTLGLIDYQHVYDMIINITSLVVLSSQFIHSSETAESYL